MQIYRHETSGEEAARRKTCNCKSKGKNSKADETTRHANSGMDLARPNASCATKSHTRHVGQRCVPKHTAVLKQQETNSSSIGAEQPQQTTTVTICNPRCGPNCVTRNVFHEAFQETCLSTCRRTCSALVVCRLAEIHFLLAVLKNDSPMMIARRWCADPRHLCKAQRKAPRRSDAG